jgi:hypothetical protein
VYCVNVHIYLLDMAYAVTFKGTPNVGFLVLSEGLRSKFVTDR